MRREIIREIIERICSYTVADESVWLDDSVLRTLVRLLKDYENEQIDININSQRLLLFSSLKNNQEVEYFLSMSQEYVDYLNEIFLQKYIKGNYEKKCHVDVFCLSKCLTKKSIEQLSELINAQGCNTNSNIFHLLAFSEDASCIKILQDTCPKGYVLVPAGDFVFGSNDSLDERYDKKVWLPSFYITRYPITQQIYNRVISERMLFPDLLFNDGDEHDYPCHGVTWYQAEQFASATGTCLPTEAQWEKAARGVDGRTYPWGNVYDAKKLNAFESDNNSFTRVDAYKEEGGSPYGVLDIVGNCWEWTSSLYEKYDKEKFLEKSDANTLGDRVLRGGAFDFDCFGVTCTNRYRCNPENGWDTHGFRVVINL